MNNAATVVALVLMIGAVAVSQPRPPDPVAEKPTGPSEDDLLRLLLAKSDVVVTGEFISVLSVSKEAGVNHYQAEVKIDGVVKGDQKNGASIELTFVRVEPKREDLLPILKEKTRVLLFLQKPANVNGYAPADPWLAFQHPHTELLRRLQEWVKVEVPRTDRFCAIDDVLEVTGDDKSMFSVSKVIEVLSSYRKVTREQYLIYHHIPRNITRQVKMTNGKTYTLNYEPGYAATLRDVDRNVTYLLHPTLNAKK